MLPTPNLSLNRPDHGDFPDTWEIPVNFNMDIIDALFDAATGHTHDGTAGNGPKIDHADLLNIGALSHAQLDLDSGLAYVTGVDTTLGNLSSKIVAGTNVTLNVLNPGANEQIEIDVAAVEPSIGGGSDPTGTYGWKSFVPTSAGVSYTDNFSYPPSFSLKNAAYATDASPATVDFISTGYSAQLIVDPSAGAVTTGRYCSTVLPHIPHSPTQRAAIDISKLDYSELEVGDSVSFTLGLYSSHTLGPAFPQKYGVLLEVHFTKIDSVPTYQVSSRVLVIPDDGPHIQVYEYHSSTPGDVDGCWEISLDANGHLYHYWRRNLVFTTQTTPPSSPGPVSAYFSALTSSLKALGEPPFGGIGFGCQYNVTTASKFYLEIRWFAMNAEQDIYYDAGVEGAYPLLGPTIVNVPINYWTETPGGPGPGIPGAECCPPPYLAVAIGDVVGAPPSQATVVACNTIPTPLIGATFGGLGLSMEVPGYQLDVNGPCIPCPLPFANPVPPVFKGVIPVGDGVGGGTSSGGGLVNVREDWEEVDDGFGNPEFQPREGHYIHFFLEDYVWYISPFVEVVSSTADLEIINVEWIDYNAIQVWAKVAPDSAGTSVSLDIRDQYTPLKSITLTDFFTIQAGTPVIDTIEIEEYETGVSTTTFLTQANHSVTIHGHYFNLAGSTSLTTNIGTLTNVAVVDAQTITAKLDLLAQRDPEDVALTVSITGGGAASMGTAMSYHSLQIVSGDVDAVAIGSGTGTLTVPYITDDLPATIAMESSPIPGNIVFVVTGYAGNTLSFTYTITVGAAGPYSAIVTDLVSGLNVTRALLTVGGGLPLPAITGVTTSANPYVGRNVSLTISGVGLGSPDLYVTLAGMVFMGSNGTIGNVVNTTYPGAIECDIFINELEVPGPIAVTVTAPDNGVSTGRTDTMVAAFSTLAVPVMTYVSEVFGGPVDIGGKPLPGTAGTLTITGTNFTTGAGEIEVSTTSDLLEFTGPTAVVGLEPSPTITIPYAVSPAANGELAIPITITQNLNGSTVSSTVDLAYEALTLSDISYDQPLQDGRVGINITLTGTGFDPGGAPVVTTIGALAPSGGLVSATATEIVYNAATSGVGPGGLQITNTDGQFIQWNGWVDAQSDVEVDHGVSGFDSGDLYSGLPTTLSIYGDNLDVAGMPGNLSLTNATILGAPPIIFSRTYMEIPINVTGPPGSIVTASIAANAFGGPYGPYTVASIKAAPTTVDVTGVTPSTLKEATVGQIYEIYGDNLNLVVNVEITFKTGEDMDKGPVTYLPKGITSPVIESVPAVITPDKITLTLDTGPGLARRLMSITLSDGAFVPLYEITDAFLVTPFSTDVIVIDEPTADATADLAGGATYVTQIPLVGFDTYFPGDVWAATGAVINTWDFFPLAVPPFWELNVTNNAAPGFLQFDLTRPGVGPNPPIITSYVPGDGNLI